VAAVEALSADQLAARAGILPSEVDRLVAAGVLDPEGGSGFRPAAVLGVRLVLACEEAGLPVEEIGRARAAGRLSFAFLETSWFQRFPPLGSQTLGDLAGETGVAPEVLERSLRSFGYPDRKAGDPVRADEVEILRLIGLVIANGILAEDVAIRFGRAVAESLRRVAQAENQIYHDHLEVPLLRSGLTQRETMQRAALQSNVYTDKLERAIMAAYRRQQELATLGHLVEHIEAALEEGGTFRRPDRPTAVCFLDLEGYTRLTEERGDQAAARLADAVADVVEEGAAAHRGQAVKWLGDGVMSIFRDPADAVTASLSMVSRLAASSLPAGHVGIAAGPVVAQAGDYFGRTVNAAARISAFAEGGQVLVDGAVAEFPVSGVEYEEVGPVELQGLRPMRLFEARAQSDASRPPARRTE
jgi:class 3 adenylate cyclase